MIPQPADQIRHRQRRGSAGGRPPAFDAEDYNLNYRGGAVLNAIVLWLRQLRDTP